jgi:hypothetical protein
VKRLVLIAVLGLPLVACGPVSQKAAEQECFERARLAAGPRGTIAVGGGSNGAVADFDVTIGSDFLRGRDPAQVYETCVTQKTGQFPTVPLYQRPDWKG